VCVWREKKREIEIGGRVREREREGEGERKKKLERGIVKCKLMMII